MTTRTITIDNESVTISIGDILVLSPSTFGNPDQLEFGVVTHVSNLDSSTQSDGNYFQIRTDKHAWDFMNHYRIIAVFGLTQNWITKL
jgi:hypothetical protein